MKVRIKFSKEGPMKFVGHLDTMRYFQKALRRAELPEFAFTVKRLEMYADEGENASPRFVTLESLGEEIE